MPTAFAPSTSSSIESPTIAAVAGSTSRLSSAARKIVGGGLGAAPAARLARETLQRGQEDRRVRLGLAVGARTDRGIDVEIVVPDELIEIASRIRDEAELEPVLTELRERRQDVFEDLEVVRVLPCACHLDRAFVGAIGVAAHAADDLLSEEHPNLLVVVELRVPLERRDGVRPRIRVALGFELDPEPLAQPLVALRAEIGAGLG